MSAAKEEARKLLTDTAENASWDDIMYQFYVRKKIDVALRQAETGNLVSHEEVKREHLS
jgi:predicted transcriptional regulator